MNYVNKFLELEHCLIYAKNTVQYGVSPNIYQGFLLLVHLFRFGVTALDLVLLDSFKFGVA